MSHATTRCVAAYVLIGGIVQAVSTTALRADQKSPDFQIGLNGMARMVVKDAIDGAVQRLTRPTCQRVFTDFADTAGHPLSANLEAAAKTATEYLARLRFVDGDGFPQCRVDQSTILFTVPNGRVIYVCGARFAARFARKTAGGEILIIHELLHALGLGENPPTSAYITDAVMTRCGG